MAALRPVPGVARIVCTGNATGVPIVNVFHVQNGVSGPAPAYSSAGMLQLVTAFEAAYRAQILPRLSSNYSGDTVAGVDLSGPTGEFRQVSLSGGGVGAGLTVPQSAACCITWKIARHYRGGHPRTYMGPLPTSAIESPTSLAAAYMTSASTSAQAFVTAINAITADGIAQRFVAVHRQIDGLKILTPITSLILSGVVDSRIDSMRRRLGPDR
jgi:hypothetical protein